VNIERARKIWRKFAICCGATAKRFNVTPRVAMLSFSNFWQHRDIRCRRKCSGAVQLVREADPTLMNEGEMMRIRAVAPEIIEETYPFSKLRGGANVLVFPDLTSANTCYKLLRENCGAEAIGPILMGMSKPVHVLQRGAEVEEIVNIAAIAVVDAQETGSPGRS